VNRCVFENKKFQAPKTKSQTISKFQAPMTQTGFEALQALDPSAGISPAAGQYNGRSD